LVKAIFFSRFKKKFISELCYVNGIKVLSETLSETLQGSISYSYNFLQRTTKPKLGDRIPLFFLKNGSIISHLKLINTTLNKINTYATVPGSYIKVKMLKLEYNSILVELPSKKQKLVSLLSYCRLGSVFGDFIKQEKLHNAGFFKITGKASKVRGVAKNACDHPNGGNTKKKKM